MLPIRSAVAPLQSLSRRALPPRAAGRLAACRRPFAGGSAHFDKDLALAYNRMAENHRHPDGPWLMMRDAVVAEAPGARRILDLASGPGEPAATIAVALPGAAVVATDVSEDMVRAAREATRGLANVTAQLADAQDLADFEDGSVDVVTCCYGYMFPDDKTAALRETHRVLAPGGMLVATTWDSVDMLKISKDVMTAVLGQVPPPPPVNPMSLAEAGLFERMVSEAGFASIKQSTSTYPFDFGDDKDFQFKIGTILLKEKIDSFGEEGWAKAAEAFWANISKYTVTNEAGSMVMPANTFRITVARKA